MLEYLAESRTIEEMAQHRFSYRPHVETCLADSVERGSADLLVQCMLARGEAKELEIGGYRRVQVRCGRTEASVDG